MLVAVVLLLLFCTCVDFVVLWCVFVSLSAVVSSGIFACSLCWQLKSVSHALFVFLQVKPHDGVRQANMPAWSATSRPCLHQ